MKTKILTLSLISIFIFSCKSDDENAGTQPIPADEKLLESIVGTEAEMFRLTYNPDKTVKTINILGFSQTHFTYENSRIASALLLGAEGNTEYIFHYDDNGILNSITEDDIVTEILYNAAGNFYIARYENLDETTLYLNQAGDIEKILIYDRSNDETTEIIYLYDDQHKGGLANSNNFNLYMILAAKTDTFFVITNLYISHRPVTAFSGMGLANFEYEYDEQGFIKKSILVAQGEEDEVIYNYTQL